MLKVEELMRSRSPQYNECPRHLSVDACGALLEEAGVVATTEGKNVLGDILENFALLVASHQKGSAATARGLEDGLRAVIK